MWLIKSGTTIRVYAPFGKPGAENGVDGNYDHQPWKPYITAQDKMYDKHEVWDMVAVRNGRQDVPAWAKRNIEFHGFVVIKRDGKYAMCPRNDIVYLD